MSRPAVVDGRVEHRQGAFELVLCGRERAQAHADILRATDRSLLAAGLRFESDRAVAEIIRRDPSLLLEPIPHKYPLPRVGTGATWSEADSVWRNHKNWYGNWLTRLSDPDVRFVESIRVALEFGIHPDDDTVWPEKTLLAREGWCENPNQLSLALSHGARPTYGDGWDESYLRRVIVNLRFLVTDAVWDDESRQSFADAITCSETLLDAGTQELDLEPHVPSTDGQYDAAARATSALGLILDSNGMGFVEPEYRDRVFALIGRLHAAGVDIDRRNGVSRLPPVVQALRCANIEGACHLVSLGCKTSDGAIVRRGMPCSIKTLPEEAFAVGKEPFRTRIIEAVLKRQLAQGAAGASVDATAHECAPRRRMGI
jgi:hypothetical protein